MPEFGCRPDIKKAVNLWEHRYIFVGLKLYCFLSFSFLLKRYFITKAKMPMTLAVMVVIKAIIIPYSK